MRIVHLLPFVLGLASCSYPQVELSITFPSQESFLVSNAIDLQIVPLGTDPEQFDRCANLLGDAIQGTDVQPSFEALGLLPCDVLHGTSLPDPGAGAHAYIVLGRATNGVILGGCTVADAFPGSPPIEINLFPTNTMAYDTAVMTVHPAPGATAEGRCMSGGTP